ncbi:MAG: acyl-CoA dehydrogenase family protein [Candidatus Krumholzibacteria bacterium]|jgi:butyryl-CoA dehydrogenase|nr:acyl-CoA dehydrogenase family protein [Candidatus Krumholzibacteria bacterium]MDP7021522.1 acyl-CoA dehydrogenase family protein [Candidatus Krumholzibacteria bacterium]
MLPFLSEENLVWKEKARKIADEVVRPIAQKYDEAQEYPWEVKEALAEAGLLGVWIPKEYGGAGAGVLDMCLVVEELSKACGGIGVAYAVNALGSFPIILAGSEEQKKRYLPLIASGQKLIAFGLSEKTAGSDAGSLRTSASEKGGQWTINGEKKWTTNGGIAEIYTIFAVTNPESQRARISGFIVEKDDPGFSIAKVEDKMGIRAVPVVELDFDDCTVPEERLLGGVTGKGFQHAMMTLDRARPGVAAQGLGLAQGALDYAAVYANRRSQFGKTIGSFQMIQGMLADMSSRVEAARYLVYAAAKNIDMGAPNISKLAAQAKLFATDTAMSVATDAVQIFGGYGYMKDYPIEKFMRDAKITQIYEGTNQVQRMVTARWILKEARDLKHLEEFIPEEIQREPALTK